MKDLKLFEISGEVKQISSSQATLEKELQNLIEKNMFTFFGVQLLKSEFVTSNGGRIDSLGIDENNCPIIFEYKRSLNENVINQGLFYLDWLMDHKADYELLVMKSLGKEKSDEIDWTMPKLICVAGDFTKFDIYAVNQINRNIDLIIYKKFGDNLLLFELVNSNVVKPSVSTTKHISDIDFEGKLASTSQQLKDLFESLRDFILSLGDDITENQLKKYIAFRKMKNVICVEVYQKQIILHLKLNPETVELIDGFTRDVRKIGHFGTGDLEISIKTADDFEKSKPLLQRAYLEN